MTIPHIKQHHLNTVPTAARARLQRPSAGAAPSATLGRVGAAPSAARRGTITGAALALVLSLVFIPTVQGAATEDFESGGVGYPPVSGFYTQQVVASTPGYVDIDPEDGDNKVWRPSNNWLQLGTTNYCVEASEISFSFRITSLPSASNLYVLGLWTAQPSTGVIPSATIAIDTTGAFSVRTAGTTGSALTAAISATPYVAGTWRSATLGFSGVSCGGSSTVVGQVDSSVGVIGFNAPLTTAGGLDAFGTSGTVSGISGLLLIDDMTFGLATAPNPPVDFCSDRTVENFGGDARADFGYNYVDSTVAFDDTDATTAGFSDGYIMESDDSGGNDPASLGKGWTGTVRTAEVRFRIDAATEGSDSNFRAVFSFDSAVPSASSVGNVRTTGSFADHVAVRLKEVGNDWRVNLEYVNAGVGPAQVGGSFIGLNPNDATTFVFRVDTSASNPYFSIRNADTDTVLLNQTLNQGTLAAKIDDYIFAQWFVSEGGSAVLDQGAFSYIDDNDQAQPYGSTCVRLFSGGLFEGSPGTIPGYSFTSTSTSAPVVGGGFGGGGILNLAADTAVYVAISIILGFAVVAWGLTTAGRQKQ